MKSWKGSRYFLEERLKDPFIVYYLSAFPMAPENVLISSDYLGCGPSSYPNTILAIKDMLLNRFGFEVFPLRKVIIIFVFEVHIFRTESAILILVAQISIEHKRNNLLLSFLIDDMRARQVVSVHLEMAAHLSFAHFCC